MRTRILASARSSIASRTASVVDCRGHPPTLMPLGCGGVRIREPTGPLAFRRRDSVGVHRDSPRAIYALAGVPACPVLITVCVHERQSSMEVSAHPTNHLVHGALHNVPWPRSGRLNRRPRTAQTGSTNVAPLYDERGCDVHIWRY